MHLYPPIGRTRFFVQHADESLPDTLHVQGRDEDRGWVGASRAASGAMRHGQHQAPGGAQLARRPYYKAAALQRRLDMRPVRQVQAVSLAARRAEHRAVEPDHGEAGYEGILVRHGARAGGAGTFLLRPVERLLAEQHQRMAHAGNGIALQSGCELRCLGQAETDFLLRILSPCRRDHPQQPECGQHAEQQHQRHDRAEPSKRCRRQ